MKGGSIIVEIKLIGSKSKNGLKMKKVIERTINDNEDIECNFTSLDDENSIKKYNIKQTPGLVINNKLIFQGKTITERELKKLLILEGI